MILRELDQFNYRIIEKAKKPGILMTIGGVFQRADTVNANNRLYGEDLWKDVLTREDTKERLEARQMVGMLGHPASGQTDPEKISHVITRQELRSDKTVYGEADVLDTPMGRVAATLFEAGVKLGISSRGDGSIEKKGGKGEVQKDFRLETYDFVLKPSTPGAYPGIVENVEENEKLVVDAIEGLVNSELPQDKRVPVLLESLQILSVLESATTVDQVKSLSEKIQEELKPTTVLTIEARDPDKEDDSEEDDQQTPTQQETTMTKKTESAAIQVPAIQQMDPDSLQWHRDQLAAAVADAVAQKDEEIRQLKDTLIKGQREHTETRKRLSAAESIIEDFQARIKKMQEGRPASDPVLEARYNGAVELLDEALKRLPELGEMQRRCSALEGLLEASIDRFREEKIQEAVDACLLKVASEAKDQVRHVLESCKSPDAVQETFKALMAVAGQQPQRVQHEPLPGMRLSEQAPATRTSTTASSFTQRLGARLSRVV